MSSIVNEYDEYIDVIPGAERDLHISGVGCRCFPIVNQAHPDAKPVITHYSSDELEAAEAVYREAA